MGICLDVVASMTSENWPRSKVRYAADAISDMATAIWVLLDRSPASHIDRTSVALIRR